MKIPTYWLSAAVLIFLAVPACSFAWNEGGGEKEEAEKLTPNLENGSKVYNLCSSCHRGNGWGRKDGSYPQLAGQHTGVLIKQLADIRAKNRDNPSMYKIVRVML